MAAMDYEEAVLNFLTDEQNIEFVWEIGERFQKVKERLHLKFWYGLYNKLDQELQNRSVSWKVLSRKEPELLGQWGGLSLNPEPDPNHLHLRFGIEQENLRLFTSVSWNAEIKTELQIPAVIDLRKVLEEKRFRSSPWQLGWKWTDIYPQSRNFCLRMAQDQVIFVEDVAQLLLGDFDEFASKVEEANAVIAEAVQCNQPYP